jgi:regulator of protease activity HflC (stomatin/prohibitin superfamily)
MGFTFRDSSYQRRVYFGKRTIKKGEKCMIWRLNGTCKTVEGPKLVRLWFSTIRFCTQFSANERQFLIVDFKDGHTEYLPGPTTLFFDHLKHKQITVKNALTVNRGEAVTVIHFENNKKDKSGSNKLIETIKEGPLLFFPTINQTLKKFSFEDEMKMLSKKKAYNMNQRLSSIDASDMYNQDEVIISLLERNNVLNHAFTSNDGYKFTVKLSLTWKINDVSKMLQNTQNPLNLLKNSLISDLTRYSHLKNYEDLIHSSSNLNLSVSPSKQNKTNNKVGVISTDVYPSLLQLAKNIGVEICNVAYQGSQVDPNYKAKCDAMYDEKKRKKDQLEKDNEKERREDFKLTMALARADKQTKKEFADMKHRQKLLDEAHKAKLKREQETFDQNLQQEKKMLLLKSEFYKSLQTNGVDLTKYLVAKVSGVDSKTTAVTTLNETAKFPPPQF